MPDFIWHIVCPFVANKKVRRFFFTFHDKYDLSDTSKHYVLYDITGQVHEMVATFKEALRIRRNTGLWIVRILD